MNAQDLFANLAGRYLFRHARVTAVSAPSPSFRRIDLQRTGAREVPWTPGDKVQVYLPGHGMRTYTPFAWRDEALSLLGFLHGDAPGANWVRTAKPGDEVAFFGPRRSLDAAGVTEVVVVGDETSLAVALALASVTRVRAVLEAGDVAGTQAAADALGLSACEVTARHDEAALLERLTAHLAAGATPFFTGRAATTQRLQRALKEKGVRAGGRTKAYWAEGKRGLD